MLLDILRCRTTDLPYLFTSFILDRVLKKLKVFNSVTLFSIFSHSPLLSTPPQPPTITHYRPTILLEGETGVLHLGHFTLPNLLSNSVFPSPLPPHSYSHLSPSLLHNTMRISSGRNPSNLITIKPIKYSPRGHPHIISFHLLNARNLRTKSSRFLDYVSDHHPDVVAVTETWFTSRDSALRAECTRPGYQLLHRARSAHRQGGGTALLCRDSFTLKCNASGEISSFEFSDWTISSSEISLRIILIYRPPYSRNSPVSISAFLEQFSSLLEPIVLCKEPLLITGDFNIHPL